MRYPILALLVALLVALPAAGVEPKELVKTMDGFRKEIPPEQALEGNGGHLKDADGKSFALGHLSRVARQMGVTTRAECLVLLAYLNDPDPKIRFIAARAIETVVRAYPGGMSLDDVLKTDSDGHREMVRRFTEKVASADPEPGPESGGLRLRLVVAPPPDDGGKVGFDVPLEVLNVSKRAVALRAGWRDDGDTGNLKDYIEASAGIETYPPSAPFVGDVRAGKRTAPQPEHVLKAGEVLAVSWRGTGRLLKNTVSDPHTVQNPELALPGLYSVHANLLVITGDGAVPLRSNEQLVSVGGSRETPRHAYGPLLEVSAHNKSATVGLGSLHKVERRGDRFRIQTGKAGFWTLTVTDVSPRSATGRLEFVPRPDATEGKRTPERLIDHATLLPPK